jgi:hypothetical protein
VAFFRCSQPLGYKTFVTLVADLCGYIPYLKGCEAGWLFVRVFFFLEGLDIFATTAVGWIQQSNA